MEAITRHLPIIRNGPILYIAPRATAPSQLPSIALAVPKVARQRARLHMQTQHTVEPGDSAFQFWQPAMSLHTCTPTCTQKKKGLPMVPSGFIETYGCGLAQLVIKIDFLGGRVEGLPLFTAPQKPPTT